MDAVDIIILAAAGVGLAAFVVLAVIILRQGRALKELEERIGPPVPPAAAPCAAPASRPSIHMETFRRLFSCGPIFAKKTE
ncbi:MAG: hypothetical protein ACPGRF_05665, partial [Miltoncostaeaceae bacterium]